MKGEAGKTGGHPFACLHLVLPQFRTRNRYPLSLDLLLFMRSSGPAPGLRAFVPRKAKSLALRQTVLTHLSHVLSPPLRLPSFQAPKRPVNGGFVPICRAGKDRRRRAARMSISSESGNRFRAGQCGYKPRALATGPLQATRRTQPHASAANCPSAFPGS